MGYGGKHKPLNATKASSLCIWAPFCTIKGLHASHGGSDDVIKGDTLGHEFDSNLWNAFCVIHASQKHCFLRVTAAQAVCHIHYPTLGISHCAFWSILQALRAQCRAIFLLQEVSSKGNVHKSVFITLVSKKKYREPAIVAWGLWREEKRQSLTMEKCFRQDPVPRRKSRPCLQPQLRLLKHCASWNFFCSSKKYIDYGVPENQVNICPVQQEICLKEVCPGL